MKENGSLTNVQKCAILERNGTHFVMPRLPREGVMLTLTRKVGESIRIGDDVQVVVKEIRRGHVRIGILAPREIKIYREEVYLNIIGQLQSAGDDE
jgi:carbon storage regulator